jgi:hypothetical protein
MHVVIFTVSGSPEDPVQAARSRAGGFRLKPMKGMGASVMRLIKTLAAISGGLPLPTGKFRTAMHAISGYQNILPG